MPALKLQVLRQEPLPTETDGTYGSFLKRNVAAFILFIFSKRTGAKVCPVSLHSMLIDVSILSSTQLYLSVQPRYLAELSNLVCAPKPVGTGPAS